MSSPTHVLVARLVNAYPELRPLLAAHLDAYGELFPHVFFGELTRWLVDAYRADPNAGPGATWLRLVADLEQTYETGDRDIRELLYVSFLENLPYPDEEGASIAGRLGPQLAADLANLR
jgi:hypothetical protein